MADERAPLAALHHHLQQHQHPLLGTILTVAFPSEEDQSVRVNLRETLGGEAHDWVVFHTWAVSLGAEQATVTSRALSTTYSATGTLADGTPAEVSIIRHGGEDRQQPTVIPLAATGHDGTLEHGSAA